MNTDSQEALTEIRRLIGCGVLYTEEFVRARCEIAYGRPIADRTWRRWKLKVRAEADPPELCGVSEATYLLLLIHATLLRGNKVGSTQKGRKVPLLRLTTAVEKILQRGGDAHWDVPEILSYEDLKQLVELQSLRTYTDRYHRLNGLKKSQPQYSKLEAIEILSKYPDCSYVNTEAA